MRSLKILKCGLTVEKSQNFGVSVLQIETCSTKTKSFGTFWLFSRKSIVRWPYLSKFSKDSYKLPPYSTAVKLCFIASCKMN